MAVVTNLGTGGAALDAQYGSSPTSNTNEPLLLGHAGTNYLYIPGVSGNFASTPDAAALDITGDIDIRVRVALDDWTPSTRQTLVAKFDGNLPGSSYQFAVQSGAGGDASGCLQFRWFNAANTQTTASTLLNIVGAADGTAKWVRVTLDVDNGAAGSDAKFYTSDDGATWVQLGATVTTAGVANIASNSTEVRIGQRDTETLAAKFYRAQIRNGIGGTTVFDADFTTGITSGAQTTFTESSTNAATVTINRSTSGRKSCAVVRPVWLLGTDDFFEVADNALLDFGAGDSFTVVAVVRQSLEASADRALVSKREGVTNAAGIPGWTLAARTTGLIAHTDSTAAIDTAGPIAVAADSMALRCYAMVKTGSTSLSLFRGGTQLATDTSITSGDLSNANVMRIGRSAGLGTNYADAELLAVAVFRRALSASELATIATYYGAV